MTSVVRAWRGAEGDGGPRTPPSADRTGPHQSHRYLGATCPVTMGPRTPAPAPPRVSTTPATPPDNPGAPTRNVGHRRIHDPPRSGRPRPAGHGLVAAPDGDRDRARLRRVVGRRARPAAVGPGLGRGLVQ